jgi:hypothetical protein
MHPSLPTEADLPRREIAPVSADEILNWTRVSLFIPVVGLVLAVTWIVQRRPGAWGCFVAVLIYTAIVTFGPYLIYRLAML